MPIAPELRTIPEMIGRFNRAGLTGELIEALIRGRTNRDLVADAKRLTLEFNTHETVAISGLENLPTDSGCLVVFNHPNMDVLFPAMLELIVQSHARGGRTPTLLMGAEIPLLAKFNETYPLPGSITLMRRLHRLYPANFIPVPISTTRKDFDSGRFLAIRKAITAFRKGNMILVSPEGHVEINNTISPIDTFHSGSGGLSIIAGKAGIPTVPVGIWQPEREGITHVNVGPKFLVTTTDAEETVTELMFSISQTMPVELRGPFA